ncbi:MAG: ABC transporter permease DevC [Gammaproteobacteria bacterium]
MSRFVPLAWLQLKHQKLRLVAAVMGIGFAVILIFIQLGFKDALLVSAVKLHNTLDYDLAMVSPTTDIITTPISLPRNRLVQVRGVPGVESVTPVYIGKGRWQSPFDPGMRRTIMVLGFNPAHPGFQRLDLEDKLHLIKMQDRVLHDRNSRTEYGPVYETLQNQNTLRLEVNEREIQVADTYELGTSFGFDGSMITSDLNFLRIFDERKPSNIDLGLIKLNSGEDILNTRERIMDRIPDDVVVLTKDEFIEQEVTYWSTSTSIGYIFNFGVVMGFVVGIIIVYQILFSDVQDHLKEYATLKAMGYTHTYLSGLVLQEAVILSLLGFLPAAALTEYLYQTASAATQLPIYMTLDRWFNVLFLTIGMCAVSALIAVRKLKSADPAEVF